MASPLRPLRAEKCNPCLRNVLLTMSRNGHFFTRSKIRSNGFLYVGQRLVRFVSQCKATRDVKPCGKSVLWRTDYDSRDVLAFSPRFLTRRCAKCVRAEPLGE